jgi:hypothetical protein
LPVSNNSIKDSANRHTQSQQDGARPIAASILDHALAVAERGLLVFPLSPMSKVPRKDEPWKEIASSDPAVIAKWFAESPRINYGIRTGSVNNLFVIDLDGPGAQAWWRSQGFADGARVITPSGPERTHMYFQLDATIEVGNSQGGTEEKPTGIFPHVDTRGEGGYTVGPGSVISTGTYQGDLSSIPDAPTELIALMPQKQEFTYEPAGDPGDKPATATRSELRRIQWITDSLDALPRTWSEGAGWRSTLFSSSCWLSRMVNSDQYALTEDGALEIVLAHTPTDESWGRPDILAQWASARKSTAGQVAEPPVETLPPLLPLIEVLNQLPEFTSRGESFNDLVFNLPSVETEKSFWLQRQAILTEAFRAGLTEQQVATIGWGAKVSETLQEEPAGLSKVWGDVAKAKATVDRESGKGFEPPPERPAALSKGPERIQILTDTERASIADYEWFGASYMLWAESMVPVFNAPYHRLMRMMVLSVLLSEFGYIPNQGGPIWLNLYALSLGESTSGKTEAYDLGERAIRMNYGRGESPVIGGNASANALIEKLIERDGLSTLFNRDEAHELFKAAKQQSWLGDLFGVITDVFGGRVPMILRSGKKDLSGIEARAYMSVSLTGVESLMADALDDSHWRSGLLPRCIWAIGDDMSDQDKDIPTIEHLGDPMHVYEAMPKQWAAEFANVKHALKEFGTSPVPVTSEPDALKRLDKARHDVRIALRHHPRFKELRPTFIRFWINVRKCAALIAMSQGTNKVSLEHELIALEMAEEWLGNALWMAESTSATPFSRDVDKLEAFISGSDTGEVKLERAYSYFMKSGVGKRFVDEFVAQLTSEGRIEKEQRSGNSNYVLKINSRERLAA